MQTPKPSKRGRKPASVKAALLEHEKEVKEAKRKYKIWVDARVFLNGEVLYFDEEGNRTTKPKRNKRQKIIIESESDENSENEDQYFEEVPYTEKNYQEYLLKAAKEASIFNSLLLQNRNSHGPFYYDPHTKTTQVLNSWAVDLKITSDWVEKYKKHHRDESLKELYAYLKTLEDSELNIKLEPPKAGLSAFMIYSRKNRPVFKDQNPSASLGDLSRIAGNAWNLLPKEEKKYYEELSIQDKERYNQEIKEYKERLAKSREDAILLVPSLFLYFIYYILILRLEQTNYNIEEALKLLPLQVEKSKSVIFCQKCQKRFKDDTMRCTGCFDGYHYACLGFDKKKVKKIKEIGLAKWTCPDCKVCEVCSQADENALAVCSLCDRGYHSSCLQFPTKVSNSWKCPQCVKCKSCGTSKLGTKWNEDFTLCRNCERLIAQNYYCGICKKAFEPSDPEPPMVQCDGCDLWIHLDCDNMTREQYEILSKDESMKYYCPICRESHDPEQQMQGIQLSEETSNLDDKFVQDEDDSEPQYVESEEGNKNNEIPENFQVSAEEIVSAASIESLLDFGV